MKCPYCNNDMKKGGVIVDNGEMSNASLTLTWYPESELNKKNKNDAVQLALDGVGYYCDDCMKVFSEHEMHFSSLFS
jgi:hypothetical protein